MPLAPRLSGNVLVIEDNPVTSVDPKSLKPSTILLTHAHDDHIRSVKEVAGQVGGRIHLHPDDTMLWEQVSPATPFDAEITDGAEFSVAGTTLTTLHTPGHSPGSVCFWAPDLGEGGVLFSGDTLFQGGPGATGRSYSDFPTIIDSIRDRLLTLPGSAPWTQWAAVRTRRGATTAAEQANGLQARRDGVALAQDGAQLPRDDAQQQLREALWRHFPTHVGHRGAARCGSPAATGCAWRPSFRPGRSVSPR